jgi:hypothetical protein
LAHTAIGDDCAGQINWLYVTRCVLGGLTTWENTILSVTVLALVLLFLLHLAEHLTSA